MQGRIETNPLISLKSTATLAEAAGLMADCGMGAIGVLDGDRRFLGIFTERDLTHEIGRRRDAMTTRLSEVVNDFPVVVDGPVSFEDAAERMRRSHIRHLIVREGDDYRIVSMRDLFDSRDDQVEEGSSDLGYLGSFAGPWPKRAEEIMTAPPVVVRDHARLEEVAEILSDKDISGMPVVDSDDFIVGVISERDVAHALGNALVRLALRRPGPMARWRKRGWEGRRASEVMTSPPVVVSPDTPVTTVAEVMFKEEINRIPVVKAERVMGVVTRGDVLAAFAGLPHSEVDLTSGPVVMGGSWLDRH